MSHQTLSALDQLEAESIFILREVAAQFERPVMLYSVGKDSSVLLRLAQKAFYPGKIPFPLMHIDTGFKFSEMYKFRDSTAAEVNTRLIIYKNEEAIKQNVNPYDLGTSKCCGYLKTKALLDALATGPYDAAIGGARRDEEKSRAKERIFSFRDRFGQWEPRRQRPELWQQLNGNIRPDESIRVFPLSNWTELDVWLYILRENIPIVPLYYAKERQVIVRGTQLLPIENGVRLAPDEKPQSVWCRFRTLGCSPCTGAVHSQADTLDKIIEEIALVKVSERATRAIDHDQEGSMEIKKREGYF